MNFGAIQGLVNGTEQVVFDYEVTGSAVSSISTGNILNGDEDGWYTVILRTIGNSDNTYPIVSFNSDTGTNYGYRSIEAEGTSFANSNYEANTGIQLGGMTATTSGLAVFKIYAKSGAVRLANGVHLHTINGTSIRMVVPTAWVWNNTADNILSANFYTTSGLYGVGSRAIILKSNNFTNGTPTGTITTPYIKGGWVRVSSQILGSAGSAIAFTGLDGDRDIVYRLVTMQKATANMHTSLRYNSDTGSNYGYQYLSGASTTVSGSRGSANILYNMTNNLAADNYGMTEDIIFAKSGFIRPGIHLEANRVSGTTVTEVVCEGTTWNNTADNITRLDLASITSTFKAGSSFELYALRPNG